MLSGKFMFTLVGLLLAVFAICNLNFAQDTVEGFWGTGGRKWKVIDGVKHGKGGCGAASMSALPNNALLGHLADSRFVKTPALQSHLQPRFFNADIGANIRYNTPDYNNMAAPCHPLGDKESFGDMAQENYAPRENYPGLSSCGAGGCGGGCGGGCSPSCAKGGQPKVYAGGNPGMQPGYAAGDYNKVMDKLYSGSEYPEIAGALPLGTMATIDAEGNATQPVMMQNFIFANQKSRLRALGDPIRGDLPIVPCAGNWFSVHPNVNLDLQAGAMNVMGGFDAGTAKATSELIFAASGNADTTIGGANLAEMNMANSFSGALGQGHGGVVSISGYP